MRKRFLVTALLITVMIVAGTVTTVSADVSTTAYDYTITVYAGQQGHFKAPSIGTVSNGGKTLKITASQGEMVTIDQSTTGIKLDNSEYYLRGFRETGHDNDEEMAVASFEVDKDVSYEAAYGLKGGMVKYTVKYLDEEGKALRKAEEFYGMVGDKPVLSYRYVKGYQPNAYNLKKTLSKDETENLFEFTYSKNSTAEETEDEGGDNTGGNGNAGGNGTAGGNGNAGGNDNAGATNIDDNDTPQAGPQDTIDLDDDQTPMADNPGDDDGAGILSDGETPKAGIGSIAVIVGIAALLAAIVLIAFALARRRRAEEVEEGVEE